ncbi:MAG: hypothetical protein MUF39_06730 [Cyclobacteriaceae bacterium]|nr:hypothetical protein [Cyclobacteriaceae bacterium]
MKTKIKLLKFITAIAFAMVVISCSEEDVKVTPRPNPGAGLALVQFSVSQLAILENALANEVVIRFDKAASKAGEIVINVTSQDLDRFTTTPQIENGRIKLPVSIGQSQAQFTLSPANNNLLHLQTMRVRPS